MQAQVVDELHSDVRDADSDEPAKPTQEPNVTLTEIARLLEIVSRSKQVPARQHVITSCSSVITNIQLPPPVLFSRKNKGVKDHQQR